MPGFDGTGPRGVGPMTGGGRGFCTVPGASVVRRPLGMRRGGGYGYGYANRVAPQYQQEQDIDSLRSEMQSLKDTLSRIESQIEKLSEK